MDNKYIKIQLCNVELQPGHRFFGIWVLWPWPLIYDLGSRLWHILRSWTISEPLGHGQQLCEILSRSNIAVKSYGPDTYFGYVCTVTLTLDIWPWDKVMTHPWVIDNKYVNYYQDSTLQCWVTARTQIFSIWPMWSLPWRYDLGSRSWYTLLSWTTILWKII